MSADLNCDFVALVGPPNTGKTTLFHSLTGTRSHSVNYPGSTVEYAVGNPKAVFGLRVQIADTPGTYSLSPKSPEEKVTRQILFGKRRPSGLILVLDGTQLSRHLPLARQVLETGLPAVIAVTMKDLLEKEGFTLDAAALSKLTGVPVVAVDGRQERDLFNLALHARKFSGHPPSSVAPAQWSCARQAQELTWSAEIADKVLIRSGSEFPTRSAAQTTQALDRVFLHPVGGLFLFAAIMSAVFTSIFWLAAPAMDLVNQTFEFLSSAVLSAAPGKLWADFISGGLVHSLGAVLAFVPQIMILFFGITVLEDSGYLARAATLVDRPLSKIGLNGRSFVPLLSGYACAIPAMLACRTIPNRKERWLTLFIIPLMSCSARLPVFSLLLAFLFWGEPAWKPGLALAGIYLLSMIVGSVAASIANRLIRADTKSFLLLELPFYRRPSLRGVVKTVLVRTRGYLRKAGPVIIVFAVALWAATTFPHFDARNQAEKLTDSYAAKMGGIINPLMLPMGGDWRTGVSLLSAFAAREVFVSSLALVLQVSEDGEINRRMPLLDSMKTAQRRDGSPLFTPASAIGLILFFLIALQCMATVAVGRREFGSWKAPLLQLVGFNTVAYLIAMGTVQALHLFGIP